MNAISLPLHTVSSFLFVAYGKATSIMLDDKEPTVKQMAYNPRHLVDIVYNSTEHLHHLSHMANSMYMQQQLINMAYKKFLKTGTF